jgi:ABC-type bacteriocin/lantibiotic exporter with double-glycine peptidase domain
MLKLRQGDPKWGAVTIGDTRYTMSRWGCTITTLSMLSSYFNRYKTPGQLAKEFKFTKDAEIYWQSIKEDIVGYKFTWRFYGAHYSSIDKALLESKDTAVILEVDHSHWVLAIGKVSHGVYKIVDPIDGRVKTTRSYGSITGGATFVGVVQPTEPEEVIPEEDPIIAWHKKNKIIESWDDEDIPEWKMTMAWAIYKGLKENSEKDLDFNLEA